MCGQYICFQRYIKQRVVNCFQIFRVPSEHCVPGSVYTNELSLRVCCHDLSLVVILNTCVGDIFFRDWMLASLEMPSVNITMAGISFLLRDILAFDSFLFFGLKVTIRLASAQQVGSTCGIVSVFLLSFD